MLGGSADGRSLEQRIRDSRKLTLDGSKAVYDLRFGIDFSKPRRTAEAIARIVWEQDVEAWWSVKNGRAVFSPTRKVELLVPGEHNRRIARIVEDFKKELTERELGDRMVGYLESQTNREADWVTIFIFGPLLAYFIQNSEIRQQQRKELEDLFAKMTGYITISPQ